MRQRESRFLEPLAAKVPEVTAMFWLIKVLTTGMGEAASDYLGQTNLILGGVVGVGGFVLAMWLQLRSRTYHAPTYWFAVSGVAVFGTITADVLHVVTHLSYYVTTVFYTVVVLTVFAAWRRSEGTLSIHSIVTFRRECFYWCAVLATFALGTAASDLTGLTLHLGFLPSAVFFLALMAVPVALRVGGYSAVVSFWIAYVLTRPLGASVADWIAKKHSFGSGLGFGDGPVAALAIVLIAGLVGYVTLTGQGVQDPVGRPDVAEAHPLSVADVD